MPNLFPCPNPACGQVFSPESIVGAGRLACPRCGTVFQFQTPPVAPAPAPDLGVPPALAAPRPTPGPAPARPARRTAIPPGPLGARPVTRVQPADAAALASEVPPALLEMPVAQPVVEEPAPAPLPGPVVTPAGKLVNLPRRRRTATGTFTGRFLAYLIITALTGAAVWGGYWLWTQHRDDEPVAGADEDTPGNFRFKSPDAAWKQDRAVQLGLKVQLALLRRQPPAGMGILFHDFKTRQPRDAELVERAVATLRNYFKPLEWQPRARGEARLADRPALALDFEGEDPNHVQMRGECRMVSVQGFGYWFFTWAPVDQVEEARPHWEALHRAFTLLNRREGWKEVPPEMETASLNEAPYQLSYVKGLWRKKAKTEGYDPQADLILDGFPPKEHRDASVAGNVQVLLLPPAADLPAAVKAAREHYLAFQKSKDGEDYPETTLEPVTDKSGARADVDGPVGSLEGHVLKLHVSNTESRERFVVLGIVVIPGHVLVATCDCDWQRRDYWESEFTALLATLRKVREGR